MCEFCFLFDFATVRARVNEGVAVLERAPTGIPFLEKQQFNFCPVCGSPRKVDSQDFNVFPKNLRYVRRMRGYTQEAIANELGLKKCAVSKWEHGRTVPSAKQLIKLCRLLNVTPQELF